MKARLCMAWLVLAGCAGPDGGSQAVDAELLPDVFDLPDGSLLDGGAANPLLPRVENTTCKLPPSPPLGAMELEEAFPTVDVDRPVWLGTAPGGSHLYLIAQGGTIFVFDPQNPNDLKQFLRISVNRDGNEEGLLGLAFHPGYAENGRFYIYYSASGPRRSVVSELRRSADDPLVADRDSERIIMEVPQPFSNHNGGDLRFGPDGYLYISLGDGGSAGDPQNHGQRPETVLGSILRIDVDNSDPVCRTPYGIPADNPFAEGRCGPDAPMRGRPEVYAWGLRNVWRMAFDAGTGDLWAADVGQDESEEIDIITRGGNYGWRAMEGDKCYERNCDPSLFIRPVHSYAHNEGESITGGVVYRGGDLPELFGAYVYADYASGRIWALKQRVGESPEVVLLADTDHRITSFGEDADGGLYLLTFTAERSIYRLRRRAGAAVPDPIPPTLSATGCYASTAAKTLAPGVVPFAPGAPFWSDGADKARYFALPARTAMSWKPDDAFDFPVGSVLIKEFRLPDAGGMPRLFETRLLVRESDRWSGYSYRWRPDGSDADLLPGRLEEDLSTSIGPQRWLFPSRGDCEACHTREAGTVLGLTSRQLNSPLDYGSGPLNQLAVLVGAGYLRELPAAPAALPAFASPQDPAAPLEARARAWLHTNCSSCHREGGRADTEIDLRAEIPLAGMKICGVTPRHPDPEEPDAPLLAPGDAAGSVLFRRLRIRGERQMPPLGTYVVDLRGRDLVGAWIQQMAPCP